MAATGKMTSARKSRKYPDIFYETPKDVVERADADRQARIEAEARAEAAETRAQAAEARAEESEARERELLEEIARLRQQQG